MAKLAAQFPHGLAINLQDPGMTPILRAGLGGLAASIRAIGLKEDRRLDWPCPVKLGPGEATVQTNRISLSWGGDAEATLGALFEGSFCIAREGVIDFPGARRLEQWNLAIAAAVQSGYKRTFLQYGKSTVKAGAPRSKQVDLGERTIAVRYQPYSSFSHQGAVADVLKSLSSGRAKLAGWAIPGVVDRHIAFADTSWLYTPCEAICAIFAIVGCLSFEVTQSGGAGALVIPEPNDLVAFAWTRPALAPTRLSDAYVAGASDAVLQIELALQAERPSSARGSGIGAARGVTMRPTAWASQQKSRVSTLTLKRVDERRLDEYCVIAKLLPARIVALPADGQAGEKSSGYFAVASALRGFVADNIAGGRRWYARFATSTTTEKRARFLHRYRTADDDLGALRAEDRKGLIEMAKRLDDAEVYLVDSLHTALRRRFAAIAKETEGLPEQTRRNRFKGERDKWRIAFAGAKTHEQTRAALADLWGRAGGNKELKEHWREILPLLREDEWQAARDLALVALASYASRSVEDEKSEDDSQVDAASEEN